jgi:hypothetical protein
MTKKKGEEKGMEKGRARVTQVLSGVRKGAYVTCERGLA